MIGLVAYIAYRKYHQNKRAERDYASSLAELLKALSEETGADYKSLAYDTELLDLIASDADYNDLISYIENT